MAKCWTCGTHVSGHRYTCSSCESLNGIKNLQKTVKSSGKGIDYLAQIQHEGFEVLKDTLSSGLSEIASAIEWGFGEISWQLQQQTDVLRSIDHTLKTPSETKANEWRLHAEELRRRGVLEESEEFFLKALNEYRLDYRIYVGLAETYLQMNKFDNTKTYLEKSLPHAPKMRGGYEGMAAWCTVCKENVWVNRDGYCKKCGGNDVWGYYWPDASTSLQEYDYKSYSYRLIGHIYACNEEYKKASEMLLIATELSPAYSDGYYDHAQYSAQVKSTESCLSSLRRAMYGKPVYWYLAQKEQNFDPIRGEVDNLLSDINSEASGRAEDAIAKAEAALRQAREAVSKARQALIVSKERAELKSSTLCDEAEAELRLARDKVALGDYIAFLEAEPIAEDSNILASNAMNIADEEREHFQKRRAEKVKNVWIRIPTAFIGWPLLFGIIGWFGGCILNLLFRVKVFDKDCFILGILCGLIFGIDKIRKEWQ